MMISSDAQKSHTHIDDTHTLFNRKIKLFLLNGGNRFYPTSDRFFTVSPFQRNENQNAGVRFKKFFFSRDMYGRFSVRASVVEPRRRRRRRLCVCESKMLLFVANFLTFS